MRRNVASSDDDDCVTVVSQRATGKRASGVRSKAAQTVSKPSRDPGPSSRLAASSPRTATRERDGTSSSGKGALKPPSIVQRESRRGTTPKTTSSTSTKTKTSSGESKKKGRSKHSGDPEPRSGGSSTAQLRLGNQLLEPPSSSSEEDEGTRSSKRKRATVAGGSRSVRTSRLAGDREETSSSGSSSDLASTSDEDLLSTPERKARARKKLIKSRKISREKAPGRPVDSALLYSSKLPRSADKIESKGKQRAIELDLSSSEDDEDTLCSAASSSRARDAAAKRRANVSESILAIRSNVSEKKGQEVETFDLPPPLKPAWKPKQRPPAKSHQMAELALSSLEEGTQAHTLTPPKDLGKRPSPRSVAPSYPMPPIRSDGTPTASSTHSSQGIRNLSEHEYDNFSNALSPSIFTDDFGRSNQEEAPDTYGHQFDLVDYGSAFQKSPARIHHIPPLNHSISSPPPSLSPRSAQVVKPGTVVDGGHTKGDQDAHAETQLEGQDQSSGRGSGAMCPISPGPGSVKHVRSSSDVDVQNILIHGSALPSPDVGVTREHECENSPDDGIGTSRPTEAPQGTDSGEEQRQTSSRPQSKTPSDSQSIPRHSHPFPSAYPDSSKRLCTEAAASADCEEGSKPLGEGSDVMQTAHTSASSNTASQPSVTKDKATKIADTGQNYTMPDPPFLSDNATAHESSCLAASEGITPAEGDGAGCPPATVKEEGMLSDAKEDGPHPPEAVYEEAYEHQGMAGAEEEDEETCPICGDLYPITILPDHVQQEEMEMEQDRSSFTGPVVSPHQKSEASSRSSNTSSTMSGFRFQAIGSTSHGSTAMPERRSSPKETFRPVKSVAAAPPLPSLPKPAPAPFRPMPREQLPSAAPDNLAAQLFPPSPPRQYSAREKGKGRAFERAVNVIGDDEDHIDEVDDERSSDEEIDEEDEEPEDDVQFIRATSKVVKGRKRVVADDLSSSPPRGSIFLSKLSRAEQDGYYKVLGLTRTDFHADPGTRLCDQNAAPKTTTSTSTAGGARRGRHYGNRSYSRGRGRTTTGRGRRGWSKRR